MIINKNRVTKNTNVLGASNEELNENIKNNEENKMLNISNNLIEEKGVEINENTTNLENISTDIPTIAVNEDTGLNVSYLASNNSIHSNKNNDIETNECDSSSSDTEEELEYDEIRNNCYEEEHIKENRLLKLLKELKMFLWLSNDGEFCYKSGYDGTVNKVTGAKIKMILKNKVKFKVFIDDEDPKNKDKNINICCLRLVDEDTFTPHEDKEFFHKDGQTYRNLCIKTEYLRLDKNNDYNQPSTIIAFVKNLVNNDEKRFTYLINWLANFIQTMERTPIAIIIKGKQGTGKNLFVEEVLKPIFGESQVATIGDKEIRKQFLAPLFSGKLFLVLDEISHSYKDNYNLQNFLKQAIGSNEVLMEEKYENTKQPVRLWGPVLIFSNKSVPIAIESNSRREVVFKSGKSLTEIDFLGCGSYENLCERIHSELKDFTLYLKNWEVDKNMASIAMNTPEKEALANMTHDKAALFNEAITSGDINYFDELKDNESSIPSISLYKELEEDLKVYRVKKNYLAQLYNTLYEEKISTKTLMNLLRTYDDEFYNNSNTIGDGRGGKYFLLDGHPKKGIINDEYVENVAVQNTLIVNSIVKPLLSTLQ